MKFINRKIQFVYVDYEYLKYLSKIDPELHFDEDHNYGEKPHIGILLNENNQKYLIPLTSAKNKHKTWADVSATWYRIYEIIDIRSYVIKDNDIIVDIKNGDIIKSINPDEISYYKQKIISVLDLRKMFPIKEELYTPIEFRITNSISKTKNNKVALMMKEYFFLLDFRDKIEDKANKIYTKQINSNKVLKYHCNYKALEEACAKYNNENDNLAKIKI